MPLRRLFSAAFASGGSGSSGGGSGVKDAIDRVAEKVREGGG